MAAPTVYRVPRRFITFPQDPPPYGFLAASLLGHLLCFGGALALSALISARMDQSKIYIVNLVPSTPSLGSPEPAPAAPARARPAPPAPKARAEEKPPAPKAEAKVEEKPPARPAPVTAPAPPRPPRAVEPPPRTVEAPPRPRSLEPSDLALPRRVEKEPPPAPAAAARLIQRSLPPPPSVTPAPVAPTLPSAPARLPEPPRISAPPAAPSVPTAPAPPTSAIASRSGVDPIRLGRPSAPSTATGSIAVDASDFPFTYYLRLVQSKIGERWIPPRAAATGGERAVILFEIQRDGRVLREPSLERSSGNGFYDQSALRAVTEASPFPPLPPEFKSQSLVIHFAFEFQPDQG